MGVDFHSDKTMFFKTNSIEHIKNRYRYFEKDFMVSQTISKNLIINSHGYGYSKIAYRTNKSVHNAYIISVNLKNLGMIIFGGHYRCNNSNNLAKHFYKTHHFYWV